MFPPGLNVGKYEPTLQTSIHQASIASNCQLETQVAGYSNSNGRLAPCRSPTRRPSLTPVQKLLVNRFVIPRHEISGIFFQHPLARCLAHGLPLFHRHVDNTL